MNYRQIMFMKFAEGVPEAERERLISSIESMPAAIDELRAAQVGRGVDGGFDLGVVLDFDDEEAFRSYVPNPVHQAVIEQVRAIVAERVGGQFTVG